MKKISLNVGVPEHWNRWSKEVGESSALEIFKSHPDTVFGNQLQVALPKQEFGPDVLHRSLTASTFP